MLVFHVNNKIILNIYYVSVLLGISIFYYKYVLRDKFKYLHLFQMDFLINHMERLGSYRERDDPDLSTAPPIPFCLARMKLYNG